MNTISSLSNALSHALSVILPSPEDTLLLRACVTPGEPGMQACTAWLRQHAEIQNGLGKESTKAFLPLLWNAVQNHAIQVDGAFLTVLRTAALREQLRTDTYNGICRNAFSVLSENKVPCLVLAGPALAETVYRNAALRHSHNIDLLILEPEIIRAHRLLRSLNFKAGKPFHLGSGHWELKHTSGLPLRVHRELFQIPCDAPPVAEMWSRSRAVIVAGVPMCTLSPADSLFYVCAQAVCSRSRHSLRWVSDAWFIAQRNPDLEWEVVLDNAVRTHLALPLSVMLGYLSEQLEAPIPSRVLERLKEVALKDAKCQAVLYAGIVTSSALGRSIRLVPGWRQRALFIAWMLFPSPSYFIQVWKIRNISLLPFYYVYRPLRYFAYRLSSALKGLIRRVAWAKHNLANS